MDALILLGIKDEEILQEGFLENGKIQENLKDRVKSISEDLAHPLRNAWTRLYRRVLMNLRVNRDKEHAFEYETDDEDFVEPVGGMIRRPYRIRERRQRKLRSTTPVSDSVYKRAKGKPLVPPECRRNWFTALQPTSPFRERFEEWCSNLEQDPPQAASSAVETEGSESIHTETSESDCLEVLVASADLSDSPSGEEDHLAVPSFVTFGTYEFASTRSGATNKPPKQGPMGTYRPPVCRLRVTVGEDPVAVDVCVDSGATLSLLSKDMYQRLKYSKWLGELKKCRQKMHGASGKSLDIIGITTIYFRVEGIIYKAPVFVGDLKGVDMLLGMDWLVRAQAKIDFERMTLELNPRHTVQLSTTPMVRREAFAVTTETVDIRDRFADMIPGSVHGFATVVEGRQVKAGTAILITCQITGQWEDGIDGMFVPSNQTLAPGVLTVESIDTPKLRGNSHEIKVCLSNAGATTFKVSAGTILGHVEPLLRDLRPSAEVSPEDRAGVFHLEVGPKRGEHVLIEETLPTGVEMLFPIGARCGEVFTQDESETDPGERFMGRDRNGPPRASAKSDDLSHIVTVRIDKGHDPPPGPEGMLLGTGSESLSSGEGKTGTPPSSSPRLAPNQEGLGNAQGQRSRGVKDPQQALNCNDEAMPRKVSATAVSETLESRIEGAGRREDSDDGKSSGGSVAALAVREPSGNAGQAVVETVEGISQSIPTSSAQSSGGGTRTSEGDGHCTVGAKTASERLHERLIKHQRDRKKQNLYPSKSESKDETGWPEVREHLRCMLPSRKILTHGQAKMVIDLLKQFDDVFVAPEGAVGYTEQVRHRIEIDETKPPFKSKPRAKSHSDKEFIEQTVAKLLKEGKIKPSKSPWGSPVVLVRKKNGKLRFCVDYRQLNDVTKKDAYPIPRIDEMLDGLNGSKYFCTLDLASGYWQIAMHRDDMEKTAFITHIGLYEWTVLPFGLCNAPATFCRLMETVLSDIIYSKCMVYLDDIIAFGKTFEATLANLRAVFERLQANTLKLSPEKCTLFSTRVEYLGHEVSSEGIRPSPSKVATLHKLAMPRTLTQIKSFIGICSYYRRFIQHFSEIAVPLNDLTKKNALVNTDTPACRKAFDELKTRLMEAPMLHYVDPSLPFVLDTDASDNAIGACLAQIAQDAEGKPYERPIAFASKTLNASRRRYCTTKKELYAVVYYLNYWRSMLSGCDLIVRTDHYSLLWLLSFEKDQGCPGMYFRWASQITTHNMVRSLKIVHRPGAQHVNADALSRLLKDKRKCRVIKGEKLNGCQSVDCEECRLEAEYNRQARGSESDDSDDDDYDSGFEDDEEEGYVDIPVHVLLTTRLEHELRTPVEDEIPEKTLSEIHFVSRDFSTIYRVGKSDPAEVTKSIRRSERIAQKKASQIEKTFEKVPSQVAEKRVAEKRVQSTAVSPPVVATPNPEVELLDRGTQVVATELGFKTKVGQPLLNREPETVSQPGTLIRVTEICPAWSDEEWVEAQKADAVLARVRKIIEERDVTGSDDTVPDLSREVPEVKAYLRSHYSKLYFAPSKILCLQENKTDGIQDRDVRILRLAPADFRLALFHRVHRRDLLHYSYEKVYPILRDRFWWTNMSQDILEWCQACEGCQKTKPGAKGGRTELRQEHVVYRPMHRVAIDLITFRYPTERGNRVILSVVDYASRWIELFALKDKTAESVESTIYDEYLTRYGAPLVMHSDQGREFDNKLMLLTMKRWGVDKTRTSGFAPWSNGLVERLNRPIKMMLTQFGEDNRTNWDQHLPKVRMAINCAVSSTTGYTPHRLFFSRCEDARMPIDLLACEKPLEYETFGCHAEYVVKREQLVAEIVAKAREIVNSKIKVQADNHARAGLRIRKYRVGDYVLRRSTTDGPLQARWTGPYQVHGVNDTGHLVKIYLPMAGRSSDRGMPRMELRWIHTSNVKPVRLDKHGRLLVTIEGDEPSDDVQMVGEIGTNGDEFGGEHTVECLDFSHSEPIVEDPFEPHSNCLTPTNSKDSIGGQRVTTDPIDATAICNVNHLSTVCQVMSLLGTTDDDSMNRKRIDWSSLINPKEGQAPRIPSEFCDLLVDKGCSVTLAEIDQSPILFDNLVEYEEDMAQWT